MAPVTRAASRRSAPAAEPAPRSRVSKPKFRQSKTAPSSPIPPKLTALEESNVLYAASIAEAKKEKVLADQPECPICIEKFSKKPSSPWRPYTCPNESCSVYFCKACKVKQLDHDYRCPFCRCKLDGAKLEAPTWLAFGEDDDIVVLRRSANTHMPGPRTPMIENRPVQGIQRLPIRRGFGSR